MMIPLLSKEEVKLSEQYTVKNYKISEDILMERAALALREALFIRYGSLLKETKGLIVAGSGNNGGDALALARLLVSEGFLNFTVIAETKSSTSIRKIQLDRLKKYQVKIESDLSHSVLSQSDWIVDGLFGIGLSREIIGKQRNLIERINKESKEKWVIGIDIPSGLSADTGVVLGTAMECKETITLGFYKKGLFTGRAANYTGRIKFAQIGMQTAPKVKSGIYLYGDDDLNLDFVKRKPCSHKGDFGHVKVFIGEMSKEGAALLSLLAATKTGAGLVTAVATRDISQTIKRFPLELMSEKYTEAIFEKNPVIVYGPGCGVGESQKNILTELIHKADTLVLDADALNNIAEGNLNLITRKNKITVLTPHPKEASRLLNCEVDEIENNRYEAVNKLAKKFQCWVLLKGRGTLISHPFYPTLVVANGSPLLAKGGSGDVLTGIVASLLAQKIAPQRAIPMACFLHGLASVQLTQKKGNEFSSISSELCDELETVFYAN